MYEEKPGRLLEVVIGLLSGLIGATFLFASVYILINAPLELGVVFAIVALFAIGFWFLKVSYRLLLNRPKSSGGLLSSGALRFWCIFFILSSMAMILLGLTEHELGIVVSGVAMIIACFGGLRLAKNRAKSAFKT